MSSCAVHVAAHRQAQWRDSRETCDKYQASVAPEVRPCSARRFPTLLPFSFTLLLECSFRLPLPLHTHTHAHTPPPRGTPCTRRAGFFIIIIITSAYTSKSLVLPSPPYKHTETLSALLKPLRSTSQRFLLHDRWCSLLCCTSSQLRGVCGGRCQGHIAAQFLLPLIYLGRLLDSV
jgi:hypothetical protein